MHHSTPSTMQQQQQQAAPVVPAPGAAPHLPGATLHLQHNPHVAQMQQIDADVQIAFRGYNMQKPFADVQDAMTRLLPFHLLNSVDPSVADVNDTPDHGGADLMASRDEAWQELVHSKAEDYRKRCLGLADRVAALEQRMGAQALSGTGLLDRFAMARLQEAELERRRDADLEELNRLVPPAPPAAAAVAAAAAAQHAQQQQQLAQMRQQQAQQAQAQQAASAGGAAGGAIAQGQAPHAAPRATKGGRGRKATGARTAGPAAGSVVAVANQNMGVLQQLTQARTLAQMQIQQIQHLLPTLQAQAAQGSQQAAAQVVQLSNALRTQQANYIQSSTQLQLLSRLAMAHQAQAQLQAQQAAQARKQ